MNFFFDNCTSPTLAHVVDGLARKDGHRAFHIRDAQEAGLHLSRHASDIDWMAALAADHREWVVVTADRRIASVPAEREAFRRAQLRGFLLARSYSKMPVHQQASALLWRWPELVDVVLRFAPPVMIEVPQGRDAKLGQVQW